MNASWMLHLYPRTWRARYEDEFRAMLAENPVSLAEMTDIALGALDAHLRPQMRGQDVPAAGPLPPVSPPDPAIAARRRAPFQALFFAHLSLFVFLNMVLLIINAIVAPGNWWALYPLWGWGMVLTLHAGLTFRWRGLFGAHLALYAVLNVGLVAINVHLGGSAWSVWPLITLGVFVLTHGLMAFRRITLFQAHVLATVFASLEVLILPLLFAGADGFSDLVILAAQLWLLVLAHWLMRNRGWTLFRAHVLAFAGFMALFLLSNVIDESGAWWVQYPFVVWGAFLLAHGLVHFRKARWSGSGWEATMLDQLADRSPRNGQRTLGMHLYVFLFGAAAFALLNLMDDTETWWAVWPIGVWVVLLAIHTGHVLLPRWLLGAHLFAWIAGSVALVAIDASTDGDPWWYWPVMAWGVVAAAHAGAVVFRSRPLMGLHVLGGIALALFLVMTDLVTGAPTWWYFPAAAIVISVILHFGLTLDLNAVTGGPSSPREPNRNGTPGSP
jgi:hypothetical protein